MLEKSSTVTIRNLGVLDRDQEGRQYWSVMREGLPSNDGLPEDGLKFV
jgi:hypothetical protein